MFHRQQQQHTVVTGPPLMPESRLRISDVLSMYPSTCDENAIYYTLLPRTSGAVNLLPLHIRHVARIHYIWWWMCTVRVPPHRPKTAYTEKQQSFIEPVAKNVCLDMACVRSICVYVSVSVSVLLWCARQFYIHSSGVWSLHWIGFQPKNGHAQTALVKWCINGMVYTLYKYEYISRSLPSSAILSPSRKKKVFFYSSVFFLVRNLYSSCIYSARPYIESESRLYLTRVKNLKPAQTSG